MSLHSNQLNLKDVLISQPWEVCGVLGGITLLAAATMLGHPFDLSVWLLALLTIGVAQALLFSTPYSLVGGLAVSAAWVLLLQNAGVWVAPQQNLLEMAGLVTSIAMAIRYREIWLEQQVQLQELRTLGELLLDGELSSGLVSRSVAELRLLEESARAETSKRPVGLLLIEMQKVANQSVSDKSFQQASRAIEGKLLNVIRSYDLPFRAQDNRIGVILPERESKVIQQSKTKLCQALRNATFMGEMGQVQPVMNVVRLGVGWAESGQATGIELLTAAERSLQPKQATKSRREDMTQTQRQTNPLHTHLA